MKGPFLSMEAYRGIMQPPTGVNDNMGQKV